MKNKHILLGISGSIAAYKSAELTRRLREQGAEVRVVMTAGAQAFITPLTLQALSGNPVHSALLNPEAESAFGHIDLARWADYILIAPATAQMMAKLTIGLADDLLSTLCLATEAPIILAPAMNRMMWQADATQANVKVLQQHGVQLIGPATGSQACGETGAGRMAEPMNIVAALSQQIMPNCLQDVPILITAGATREDIDPVRFISNRSSGRMGYAMAQAAQEAGGQVTLISGKTHLPTPKSVQKIDIYSAQDMYDAVLSRAPDTAIFIATAAVADYKPSQQATQKIKKQTEFMQMTLERTQDILAAVAALDNPPFTLGFAAETQAVAHYARDKLQRKKLNMIAANQVGIAGQGFDSTDNALHVLWATGEQTLPLNNKLDLARQLIGLMADLFKQKGTSL